MMTRLVIRRWRVNELIETLRRQLNKGETTFGDAIVTACQAQRNACVMVYNKHYGDSEHYDECCGLEIFTATITKEDYE